MKLCNPIAKQGTNLSGRKRILEFPGKRKLPRHGERTRPRVQRLAPSPTASATRVNELSHLASKADLTIFLRTFDPCLTTNGRAAAKCMLEL